MFQLKEQDKPSENELNKMEISNPPDKQFKVMGIKMLTKLIRRMGEHSKTFNKEMIENIRKYQTEVIIELKNTLEGFNGRLNEVEE